uniref:Spinigerin n=1 Tax=Pseudacanthotermes spiniger TaxID=115113 RepID=SPING_PSEUS|nr:RecName: Full=Spinigerin; Contains: RecName: Full=Spinigerin N-3; Contains: RecName: Full=Spinigerin C-4 [Pseudacanthotermes spiniger]1ZRV_A Chain A, spinigerin [synthetic construct]1ZRW_A Chain A, spinigerin [synthetic construct]
HVDKKVADKVLLLKQLRIMRLLTRL